MVLPRWVTAQSNKVELQNLVRGELVNGSLGKVVDFLAVRDAINGNTDIGFIDPTNEMREDAVRRGNRDLPRSISESPNLWPVVQWASGRKMMMVPVEFTTENVHGEVEAIRGQVGFFL